MVLDALAAKENDQAALSADVERVLATDFASRQVQAVGEGSESRAESSKGDQASALRLDNVVVHLSIMAAV
jgi:hypothetical protein